MDASSNVPAPAVPQSTGEAWPGAFSIVKRSFVDFFTNITPWLAGLLAFVPLGLVIIIQIAATAGGGSSAGLNIISLLLGLGSVIAIIYVSLCWIGATPLYGLARADGRKMTIKEVYTVRWGLTFRLIGASILIMIPIIIGFFLLIIPGIVALVMLVPTLSLVPYVLAEEDLGVIDSIKAAHAMTKGHAGKVWGIAGVFILIGIILALPIILIVFALVAGSASAATSSYSTTQETSSGSSSGGGGGGFGNNPISAISYAYLYRWLKRQSPSAIPTAPQAPVAAPTSVGVAAGPLNVSAPVDPALQTPPTDPMPPMGPTPPTTV